jgi:hypothetical protein
MPQSVTNSGVFSYNDKQLKPTTMTAKSLRQQYIDDIMKNRYSDDDPKYDENNRNFLEGLSLSELASMASHEFDDEEIEDEFELEGEIRDLDFDDEELFN